MSNVASTSGSQTPQQEILDRMAEESPAWFLPNLVGLQNVRASVNAALNRVKDSHKLQQQVLAKQNGIPADEAAPSEDDMGGINVQGDTTHTYNVGMTPELLSAITGKLPVAGEAAQSVAPAIARKLLPLVLSTLLGGGAVGGALVAYQAWRAAKPTPQVQSPDYSLGLKVTDQP